MDIMFIVLSVIGFSLKSIFIKVSLSEGLSSNSLMAIRMLISFPFFMIAFFIFRKHKENESGSRAFSVMLTCSALYFLSGISDITGLKFVSISLERTLLFTIPVFTLFFSRIFLQKSYNKKTMIYCIFSWFGVAISFMKTGGDFTFDFKTAIGIALILCSAATYSLYMVLSYKGVMYYGAMGFNSRVMMCSTIPPIFILATSENNIQNVLGNHSLIMPACLSLFSTVLPSFFMAYGIKRCGPAVVATINNFGPFITLFAGYFYVGEKVSIYELLGMAIVIACIAALSKEMKKRNKEDESSNNIRFGKE